MKVGLLESLNVELPDREYPILIGKDFLSESISIGKYISGKQVLVITNETIAPLYLEWLVNILGKENFRCESLILPDGEEYKNLKHIELIYDKLMALSYDRKATLIALGGGVVGDMTGFAAATYRRGVSFIQIPTTILAQVDSSVGGKTGVNHPLGKNMIGAFYQPRCVLADIGVLDTLEQRQVSAGLAEIIKYGLIADREFFNWLEENIEALCCRDHEKLAYAIKVSCRTKAGIVAEDELEHGIRALLNLGHTFGHAIENVMGYGNWLHGEAVATGTCIAAEMSRKMGFLEQSDLDRIIDLHRRAQLPIESPSGMTSKQYIEAMGEDKKVENGKIRLVLLEKIGKAFVSDDYDDDILYSVLKEVCKE